MPWGARPGDKLKASTDDGRFFSVRVPENAKPGMTLMVTIPDAKPAAAGAVPEPVPEPQPTLLNKGTTTDGGVNPADLTSCCALCCCICSLYCKCPDAIGCHEKGQLMCCECEQVLCKTSSQEGVLCTLMRGEVELIKPTVCCKLSQQICCNDVRCSFPCDEEVPPMLACAGLTCCKNYEMVCKCGEGVGEANSEGGAPASEEMNRE